MAKISARGAYKVAETQVKTEDVEVVIVLCSDRRLLKRYRHNDGYSTGFTVMGKWHGELNQAALDAWATRWAARRAAV